MLEEHRKYLRFLEGAVQAERPDQYIFGVPDAEREAISALTCQQEPLHSTAELNQKLRKHGARPQSRSRKGGLQRIDLRCAQDDGCSFRGVILEKEPGGIMLLQELHTHSCNDVQSWLQAELQEVDAFVAFINRLDTLLLEESRQAANALSTDYQGFFAIMKNQQNELHQKEDAAVEEVWPGECRWRRARGTKNEPPGLEDLEKLRQLAQQRGCGEAVDAYIQANLHTDLDSQYFQQRGYFMLLTFAKEEALREILDLRIQVLLYARNILQQDQYLLCYSKLKNKILRNHVWMIALLIYALRFSRGHRDFPFPLPGITKPEDSDITDFYESLNVMDTTFLQGAQL